MVSDISNVGKTSLADLVPVDQRTVGAEMTQQDFLKIMIEQIRGQNPLDSEGGVENYFQQLVQFQSLDAMQTMTKAINLLAEVSSLSQSASLLGRSVTAEVPVETKTGELPKPPQVVTGTVARVSFDDTNGAVVQLDSGLLVPIKYIVGVAAPVVPEAPEAPEAATAPEATGTTGTADAASGTGTGTPEASSDTGADSTGSEGTTDPGADAGTETPGEVG